MHQWKAYDAGKQRWEPYELSYDREEKHDVASDPALLQQMTDYAQHAHEPIQPGQVFDRKVIERDR